VSVDTADEIGALARSFNSLLADLREKEQHDRLPARGHDRCCARARA
jgi:hypothetical protein